MSAQIPPLEGDGGERSEPGGVKTGDPRPNPPPFRAREFVCIGLLAIITGLSGLALQPILDRAVLLAPAPTPILYDRNGAFLAQVGHDMRVSGQRQIDYGYWPLKTLPDRVVRATLALEDGRFHHHPGVDPLAIVRAAWSNGARRKRSGASTVAMQVARMQQPGPRTFAAKLREGITALALTTRYGRDEVLSHYLRLVPYGNSAHGIAHATRFYFNKPVDDLSWAEIALLAAIPQSPTRMNPLQPEGLARAIRRGHRVIDKLAGGGVIGAPDAALAHRQLQAMHRPEAPRRPEALHAVLRYEALMRAGRIAADPHDPRIRTTIDLRLDKDAAALVRKHLAAWRNQGAEQAAVLVVETKTGRVLADVGSRGYREGQAGALDFSAAPRSPGSTLKPFIYALALERGAIKASDVLADIPEGASGIGNADGRFLGPMLPRQALANSRNVPATNLLRQMGLERTFEFLHRLGLHNAPEPATTFGLSMAIGSLPTTLERLVRSYGALARDGRLSDLVWADGQRMRFPSRVLSADTARLVTSFLADPVARLPTFPRYGPTEYPFPVALKTGTSQGYRDAWTIAWSRDYLIGVWVGRADAGTMTKLSGASSAARLAHAVLTKLHGARAGDLEDSAFPAPDGRVPVELCTFGGRSEGHCGQTLTEWVRPDEMPPPVLVRTALTTSVTPQAAIADESAPSLAIVAPEQDSRIWINPEAPVRAARIALKASVAPKPAQIVWYVDGEPFATGDPDQPVTWPLQRGTHRFQVGLPFTGVRSKPVRISVE